MKGKVLRISVSEKRGTKKYNVSSAEIRENFGLVGDAHATFKSHRQVSLLACESIEKMRALGAEVFPGDFAENLTTEGVDLLSLKIGDKIKVGQDIILEVSQIGKECHSKCEIFQAVGECVMPKEGIFGKVVQGGMVSEGVEIEF